MGGFFNGSSSSVFVINTAHVFADDAARDVYFTANPTEKVTGLLISVGSGYQEWDGATWGAKTAVVQGNAGSDATVVDATTTAKGKVELATDGEDAANVVVQGNDSRLDDARNPLIATQTAATSLADADVSVWYINATTVLRKVSYASIKTLFQAITDALYAPLSHVGSAATGAHTGLGSAAAAATTDFTPAAHAGAAASSSHSGLGAAAALAVSTSIATPGVDTKLATEKSVRDIMSISAYEFLPVEWGLDGDPAPDAVGTLSSTNKVVIRKFAGTVENQALFIPWSVPNDLTGSTVSFRVIGFVTEATGPSSEGIAFSLAGASVGDGDLLGATLGTAVVTAKTGFTAATYARFATAWSSAVTITNLLAGETALLKLIRVQDNGSDTYGQKVGVYAVEIKYSEALVA